jgi:hypothetical protein
MANENEIREVVITPEEKRSQEGFGKSAQADAEPLKAQLFNPGEIPAPNTSVVQAQSQTANDAAATNDGDKA